MSSRSVQISLDEELLREVDRQKETKRDGRSAVIRRALHLYLERKRSEDIDALYAKAYGRGGGTKDNGEVREFDALLESQAWPDE